MNEVNVQKEGVATYVDPAHQEVELFSVHYRHIPVSPVNSTIRDFSLSRLYPSISGTEMATAGKVSLIYHVAILESLFLFPYFSSLLQYARDSLPRSHDGQ